MNTLKVKWFLLMVAALCIAACQGKPTPATEEPVDTTEEEYEYEEIEVSDTTPAEVAAWLKNVPIDSVERLLCRHGGKVVTPEGKTLHVFITDVLSSRPEDAMNYPFKEAADSLYIGDHTSADGRVRIIDWNTGMGGTMPDNARYTLVRGADGQVRSTGNNHHEAVVISLYQLQDSHGQTIYLTHDYFREMSTLGAAWVTAWRLQGDTLAQAPVFPKNETQVGLEYGIPDWYFKANMGEGWDWLFELEGRNLYVPVADTNFSITDRYNLYRWTGDRFLMMGEVGNRRLHISLKDYVALQDYFVTKDYRVRIDLLADKSYRYASWRIDKQTDAQPDLVIKGGHYDPELSEYRFENNGYIYHILYKDSETQLLVKKDGRTVLSQQQVVAL